MKKAMRWKRAGAWICALALMAALVPGAWAAGFTDVRPGDWYYETVTDLVSMGAVDGFPDGSFGPDQPITLVEFCKIANDLLPVFDLLEMVADEFGVTDSILAQNAGYWGGSVIAESAGARGITAFGTDRSAWDGTITRGEMTYILYLTYQTSWDYAETEDDLATAQEMQAVIPLIGDYYTAGIGGSQLESTILWAYAAGLVGGVNGNGDFDPNGTVTRAQACTILSRMVHPENRLTVDWNKADQMGQQQSDPGALTRLADGTDQFGNTRIHYAEDVAYDYCRALEAEIGMPIFYLPEFTDKEEGLLSTESFDPERINRTYFQLVLIELQKMKEAYDLYPAGFLKEVVNAKNNRRTEIVLRPYTALGGYSGQHVYDYSDDPVKIDRIYYSGVGDVQYYSHEMGHMVMSSAAIRAGWNTACSTWENYNASATAADYVSEYAMTSRPEDWAETWAYLWHQTDAVRTAVNGGASILHAKVQYMTQLLCQYSTMSAASLPWSDLL